MKILKMEYFQNKYANFHTLDFTNIFTKIWFYIEFKS